MARPAAIHTPRQALPVFLHHASPRILLAALAGAVVFRIAAGGFGPFDLVPVAALLLFWPLQEWLIHVLVLHWRPRRVLGVTLDFRVPRSHRAHHADPSDLSLVFIPLHSYVYTLPLVVALAFLLSFALGGDARVAGTGLVAYLALALHYEWGHFLAHTRWTPHRGPYRAILRQHRLHHYKNEHYWFGVTRRAADRWLGTRPDADAVPTSPTCRALFGDGAPAVP